MCGFPLICRFVFLAVNWIALKAKPLCNFSFVILFESYSDHYFTIDARGGTKPTTKESKAVRTAGSYGLNVGPDLSKNSPSNSGSNLGDYRMLPDHNESQLNSKVITSDSFSLTMNYSHIVLFFVFLNNDTTIFYRVRVFKKTLLIFKPVIRMVCLKKAFKKSIVDF